jgi:rod shape-determining protein MreD
MHFMLKSIAWILLLCVIAIVRYLPAPIPLDFIAPDFFLIMTFFIILKARVPLVMLFIIGLFQDALAGGLLGITPLQIVIMTLFINRNYHALFAQKFHVYWLAFVLLYLLLSLVKFAIYAVASGGLYFGVLQAFSILITIFAFPIIAFLLNMLQKKRLTNA